MKVLKFGGTSVGTTESLLKVKNIVESQKEQSIVVVSALSGVTDQLYAISKMASDGDISYLGIVNSMKSRHYKMIDEVISKEKKETTILEVEKHFTDLANILKGIFLIKDITPRIIDNIVSYGETISSVIVANLIDGAVHKDSKDFIKTRSQFEKHLADFDITEKLVKTTFANNEKICVCGGFISTDVVTGKITNLGRGGSDHTAAIIASSLNATKLEIWTDVDGFMTADPRIISNAYVIQHLSFSEAMELSNFGAKVIYPPTIFPVYHKNIPIEIKNTFNPTARGTLISSQKPEISNKFKVIKGISSINDTSLITVKGLGMVGVIGVNRRIFKALANNGISVFLVAQASSENTTSIGVRSVDSKLAVDVLRDEFNTEIQQGEINQITSEDDLVTIAIVGDNMKGSPGIAGKLFGILGRNGINVVACAQGASETNISFVTDRSMLKKSLNVIHDSFFLSEYQVLNLFILGVGTVGSSLIEQIKSQQKELIEQNDLKINVIGIASSKKMLFNREGLELENCIEKLKSEGIDANTKAVCKEILDINIFNSVFVDCTANEEVANTYQMMIDNNISVVTANKISASSDYESYVKLKETSRQRGVKYLFETNVGAGLPIINTMNNLTNSGDNILKLEAVLSGTLNYIFNTLSEDIPLSKAIKMAGESGFAEPDPRIDLSGIDVIRKLVILTREAGYKVEKSDVEQKLFIPQAFFEGSIDEFRDKIRSLDAEFEQKRKILAENDYRWRFVAKMERGKCCVGLEEIDSLHPFYDLQGSNNIIMITTERYNEFPMIIKGYGAGASVTAAGVFADIISIANIR